MKHWQNMFTAPWLKDEPGVAWCAAWFAIAATASFVIAALPQTGALGRIFLLVVGGLHAYAALGLLRGLKAGWHVAAFLAFLTIVTRAVAVACAPGAIADGDTHLLVAALDVLTLAIGIVIFSWLRKPAIRKRFGVPPQYGIASGEQE